MYKLTPLAATLTVLIFLPSTSMSASSEHILSAGLFSGSAHVAAYSFETEFTASNYEITNSDLLPDISIGLAQDWQEETQALDDSLWLADSVNESDYSVYFERVGQDRLDTAIVDKEASTGFNFNWEGQYQPRESMLKKGLKQYLALEDTADFDFSILKPRVIHITADPLEYSIMNDLCFIKKCFF